MERAVKFPGQNRSEYNESNRTQYPREEVQGHYNPTDQDNARWRVEHSDRRKQTRMNSYIYDRLSGDINHDRPPRARHSRQLYPQQSSASDRRGGFYEDQTYSPSYHDELFDDHEERCLMQGGLPDSCKSIGEYDYHEFENKHIYFGHHPESNRDISGHNEWNKKSAKRTNKKKKTAKNVEPHIERNRMTDEKSSFARGHLSSMHASNNRQQKRTQARIESSNRQLTGMDNPSEYSSQRYWPEEETQAQTFDDCYCDAEDFPRNDLQHWSTPSSYERIADCSDSLQSLDYQSNSSHLQGDSHLYRSQQPSQPRHANPSLEELPQHDRSRLPRRGHTSQGSSVGDNMHFQQFSSSYVDPTGNRVETYLARNHEGRTAENSRIVRSSILQIPYETFLENTTTRTQVASGQPTTTSQDSNLSQIRQFVHRVLDTAILPMASNSLYRTLGSPSPGQSALPLDFCFQQRPQRAGNSRRHAN